MILFYVYIVLAGASIWALCYAYRNWREYRIKTKPRWSWTTLGLAQKCLPLDCTLDHLPAHDHFRTRRKCKMLMKDEGLPLVAFRGWMYQAEVDTTPSEHEKRTI